MADMNNLKHINDESVAVLRDKARYENKMQYKKKYGEEMR